MPYIQVERVYESAYSPVGIDVHDGNVGYLLSAP